MHWKKWQNKECRVAVYSWNVLLISWKSPSYSLLMRWHWRSCHHSYSTAREADEGGEEREGRGSRRGGERIRGVGTGKQMLAQQCSMLATSPSLIIDPPTPCPLSLSLSLNFGPSHNLCPLSDHTERLVSGGEHWLCGVFFLLFIFKSWDKSSSFY